MYGIGLLMRFCFNYREVMVVVGSSGPRNRAVSRFHFFLAGLYAPRFFAALLVSIRFLRNQLMFGGYWGLTSRAWDGFGLLHDQTPPSLLRVSFD